MKSNLLFFLSTIFLASSVWSLSSCTNDCKDFPDPQPPLPMNFVFNGIDMSTTTEQFVASTSETIEFELGDNVDNTHHLYTWTFGDGTNTTGSKVSHQYSIPGEYEVAAKLEYVNNCGDGFGIITSKILIE